MGWRRGEIIPTGGWLSHLFPGAMASLTLVLFLYTESLPAAIA